MKVWVLTFAVNEYDQQGEYFEAVYGQKPTVEQLLLVDGINTPTAQRLCAGEIGRWKTEYQWWYLRETEILT